MAEKEIGGGGGSGRGWFAVEAEELLQRPALHSKPTCWGDQLSEANIT